MYFALECRMENNLLVELLFLQLALTKNPKGSTGKAFGLDLYAAGQKPEGESRKSATCFQSRARPAAGIEGEFVTRVGDLGCGVGYYK